MLTIRLHHPRRCLDHQTALPALEKPYQPLRTASLATLLSALARASHHGQTGIAPEQR